MTLRRLSSWKNPIGRPPPACAEVRRGHRRLAVHEDRKRDDIRRFGENFESPLRGATANAAIRESGRQGRRLVVNCLRWQRDEIAPMMIAATGSVDFRTGRAASALVELPDDRSESPSRGR
jgi:hypothetical protein